MAVTTTWSVQDMQHNDSDGGVTIVYWSLIARNEIAPASGDVPAEYGPESAQEGGKLRLTYDASSSDFIAYASLTEADVLGWVYDSLREGDETATEAKTRVENERSAKVSAQITKNADTSTGVPWSS